MLRIQSIDTLAMQPLAPNLTFSTQTCTNKRGELINILPSQQIGTPRKPDGTFFTHRNQVEFKGIAEHRKSMINQYMQGRIVDLRNPVQGYAQESFPTAMVFGSQSKRLKTAQHRMNR